MGLGQGKSYPLFMVGAFLLMAFLHFTASPFAFVSGTESGPSFQAINGAEVPPSQEESIPDLSDSGEDDRDEIVAESSGPLVSCNDEWKFAGICFRPGARLLGYPLAPDIPPKTFA